MATNNAVKKYEEEVEDDFIFDDEMAPLRNDEAIAHMIQSMMEATQHQQIIALELTKLVVEKSSSGSMNEEKVFSVFEKASKIIGANFPLKELMDKFG